MANDDEDFDINLNDYETVLYETEIIQLWDALPDYCKTRQVLDKKKEMASPSLLNKLEF